MHKKILIPMVATAALLINVSNAEALAPANFDAMYNFASRGNIRVLDDAIRRGLDIDSTNYDGNTGLCVSVLRNDYTAYRTFVALGADKRHECISNISRRRKEAFNNGLARYGRRGEYATSNYNQNYELESYNRGGYAHNSMYNGHIDYNAADDSFISSNTAWKLGGLALVGGTVALLVSGGGGGSDDNGGDVDLGNIPGMDGVNKAPYRVSDNITKDVVETIGGNQKEYWGVNIDEDTNIINEKNITITNHSSPDQSLEHWGAISARHGYIYNNGNIFIKSDNKFAKGLMSCIVNIYDPRNTSCYYDKDNTLVGDIRNDGRIDIKAPQSVGIFASSTHNITNNGSIEINGNDSSGIFLLGNGKIQNDGSILLNGQNTTDIAGSMSGIWVSDTADIVNNGIAQVVTAGNGGNVIAAKKGSIINNKEVSLAGSGVGLYLYDGKIVNSGKIHVGAESVAGGKAIELANAGTVENNENILVRNGGTAISAPSGLVTNGKNGNIDVTSKIPYNNIGVVGYKVVNEGKINVNVNGTAVQGGEVINKGQIIGVEFGVDALNIENSGLIKGKTGVKVKSGGILKNNKQGQIEAQNVGIDSNTSSNVTILNDAMIKADKFGITSNSANIVNNANIESEIGTLIKTGAVTNNKDGIINVTQGGIYSGISGEKSSSDIKNYGQINILHNKINTDSFGMYSATGGLSENKRDFSSMTALNDKGATISLHNTLEATKLGGMYAEEIGNLNNSGDIVINNEAGANEIVGMKAGYYEVSPKSDQGADAQGPAYDVTTTNSVLTNSGKIEINAITKNSKNVAGMVLQGAGMVTNDGEILILGDNAYGMKVDYNDPSMKDSEGNITVAARAINNGTITMKGEKNTAIYASGIGSAIQNRGIINISDANMTSNSQKKGDDANSGVCDEFICLKNGAIYENAGVTASDKAMNFADFGDGSVYLMKGGSFEAPKISGSVVAGNDIVMGSNKNEYVSEKAFVGKNEGIKLKSASYMFDSSLKQNAEGNQDVVMTRKSFNTMMINTSAAEFLENNYNAGNQVNMFNQLKTATNANRLNLLASTDLGLDFFPGFAKQNLDVIKSLNKNIHKTILNNKDDKSLRATVGYDYIYRHYDAGNDMTESKDNAGSVYGMFDKQKNANWRYGFGLSYTKLDSKYESRGSRDENIVQIYAPTIYQNDALSFISTSRLGYGWGDYNRLSSGKSFGDDIYNIYYGIANELHYDAEWEKLVFEPIIEFNVLGLYQNNLRENKSLEIDSANNLSIEAGLGLYAKKTITVDDDSEIRLRAGGTYYHEFGDPYANHSARRFGMSGIYDLNHYHTDRDRAVLSADVEYQYKNVNMYSRYSKYIEDDDSWQIDAGMNWNF